MKPRSGSASLAATNLVYLIGKGETPLRRSITAERLDRTGQIGDDFTNRNQSAALTLHGFHSPMFLRQDGAFSRR